MISLQSESRHHHHNNNHNNPPQLSNSSDLCSDASSNFNLKQFKASDESREGSPSSLELWLLFCAYEFGILRNFDLFRLFAGVFMLAILGCHMIY